MGKQSNDSPGLLQWLCPSSACSIEAFLPLAAYSPYYVDYKSKHCRSAQFASLVWALSKKWPGGAVPSWQMGEHSLPPIHPIQRNAAVFFLFACSLKKSNEQFCWPSKREHSSQEAGVKGSRPRWSGERKRDRTNWVFAWEIYRIGRNWTSGKMPRFPSALGYYGLAVRINKQTKQ